MQFRWLLGGALGAAAIALGAGCSGGSSGSTPHVNASQKTRATLTITVPAHGAATATSARRKPQYVSPSTLSLLVSVSGTPLPAFNVTPSTAGCTTSGGATTCTFGIDVAPGMQTFAVKSYDRPDAAGNVLSDASTQQTITMDAANTITLTLNGDVAAVQLVLATPIPACSPTSGPLKVIGLDADGNTITGNYSSPIVLTSSNTTAHTTISPKSIVQSNSSTTITYDGKAPGYSVITAKVGGNALATYTFSPGPLVCKEYALTTAPAEPRQITTGSDGNVYFTEYQAHGIGYVVPTNTTGVLPVGTIMEIPITTGSSGGLQSDTDGIATGSDGNLWITDPFEGIDMYTPGNPLAQTAYPADSTNGETNQEPRTIVKGPDNNLWYTQEGVNTISKITTAGAITNYTIPTVNSQPVGITVGGDGQLWFTESLTNKIGSVSTAGTFHEYPVPTANSRPTFITVGADGSLWFSESDANQIGHITTGGVVTEFPITTPQAQPEGLVLGLDGNIFFAEQGRSQFGRITPDGTITEFPTLATTAGPYDLTVGPDGYLWFTELTGNNVGYIAY